MNSPKIDRPASLVEVQETVAAALAAKQPLEILGGGSKRFYGRPVAAGRMVSLEALHGVIDYQPRELICVLGAGTPLAELESLLAAEGQMLAFEPPHWGREATIGGTIACNLAGPRRFKAGAARDHLLGFQAVDGRGSAIRAGGRVVKNVTGYDLSKLMCGSFGTLGILTEVCVKVLPRGEMERTVAVAGRGDRAGLELMIQASRSAHDVSGLAHLPPGSVLPPDLAGAMSGAGSVTLLRVEGPEPSVIYRGAKLAELAGEGTAFVDGDQSKAVWRNLSELEPVPRGEGESLWRFVLPPTAASSLVEDLGPERVRRALYDWGGGLVWAVLPAALDPETLHQAAARAGGNARLVHAGEPVEGDYPVFPPLEPVRMRIHANLKQSFDPEGILNPGRIYPGL